MWKGKRGSLINGLIDPDVPRKKAKESRKGSERDGEIPKLQGSNRFEVQHPAGEMASSCCVSRVTNGQVSARLFGFDAGQSSL